MKNTKKVERAELFLDEQEKVSGGWEGTTLISYYCNDCQKIFFAEETGPHAKAICPFCQESNTRVD